VQIHLKLKFIWEEKVVSAPNVGIKQHLNSKQIIFNNFYIWKKNYKQPKKKLYMIFLIKERKDKKFHPFIFRNGIYQSKPLYKIYNNNNVTLL